MANIKGKYIQELTDNGDLQVGDKIAINRSPSEEASFVNANSILNRLDVIEGQTYFNMIGDYDALTNSPDIKEDTMKSGEARRISVAGSQFGINFEINDLVVRKEDDTGYLKMDNTNNFREDGNDLKTQKSNFNIDLDENAAYKINGVDLKDFTTTMTNKSLVLENNNITQTAFDPLDEAFQDGDQQQVVNSKAQGQINALKENNPTQLNPNVRYVSKQGDNSLNGQVDRKKQTIDEALTSLQAQSSGTIRVEAGYYTEDLILGTSRSRMNIIGEGGSQGTVIKSITYNENNQQSGLESLKLENTDNAPAINLNSTLSNYIFRNITCGGNHISNIFLNVASGGSGFVNLIGFDISNKIINFENTTTPRLAFISQSANAIINAGTGWTVIVDNNSANILELSNNNNVLRGAGFVNSLIPDNTTYNAIVGLGSAGNGFYAVNYDEVGVFAKGDIILRQNPITIVYSKHYNTQNATYYDLTNQNTLHKENGGWVISANKTELQDGLDTKQDTITTSNGLLKVGNDVRGIDASTAGKGVVQLTNSYSTNSSTLGATAKALRDGLSTRLLNSTDTMGNLTITSGLTCGSSYTSTQLFFSRGRVAFGGSGYSNVLFTCRSGNVPNIEDNDDNDYFIYCASAAGTARFRISTSGILWNSSDSELKEEIKTIENVLDRYKKIRGCNFKWKENKKEDLGVIAQEVELVFPELISQEKDKEKIDNPEYAGDKYKMVRYDGLNTLNLQAIKELHQLVEKQQETINQLSSRLDKQQEAIDKLLAR